MTSENEHNRDPADSPAENDDGFGLVAPTGNLAGDQPDRSAMEHSRSIIPEKESKIREPGQTTWKGFEEEEEDEDPDITFGSGKDLPQDELDMTPMVDVTFLLLIFFMVTASFTLIQSIQNPPATVNEPSLTPVDAEDEDDYVQVTIDQNNSYYVTSRDSEEDDAPSDREMRSLMKNAQELTGCNRLIIKAHVDSYHKKVVTVWDAGIAIGMQQIEMETIEEDY